MVKKKELQKLSNETLKVIKYLYEKGDYDFVVSNSGLVVEYALKAAICKSIDKDTYPESIKQFKTHESEKLVDLAKLRSNLESEKANNLEFFISWSLLSKWSVNFRYNPIGTTNENTSKQYISALANSEGGVHPWITKHW